MTLLSLSLFCYWWKQRLPSSPRPYWINLSRDHSVVHSAQMRTVTLSLPTGMTLPCSHLAPAQPVKQWQRKSPFLSSQRTVPPGWQGDGEHWSGISLNRRKRERERRHCGLRKRSEESNYNISESTDLATFQKNNKIICLCSLTVDFWGSFHFTSLEFVWVNVHLDIFVRPHSVSFS